MALNCRMASVQVFIESRLRTYWDNKNVVLSIKQGGPVVLMKRLHVLFGTLSVLGVAGRTSTGAFVLECETKLVIQVL